jgi:ubiquinone/menaquinone biosynthesis C-methylase UbiE
MITYIQMITASGVDMSDVQVERARRLVPGAVFLRADATDLDFPSGSFDAVVCLYALSTCRSTARREP